MEIASSEKVALHRERLAAYLEGRPIFPVTLELDLTSVCNRRCPHCPSTTQRNPHHLQTSQVETLLASLEGQTKGLLLTGGEPTLASNFKECLRLARQYQFEDVVVVSNGAFLGDAEIIAALLEFASAVRLSLYDWNDETHSEIAATFAGIEHLRKRVLKEGSGLRIGLSALTTKENASSLESLVGRARSAGAHWMYFHPLCLKWDSGYPEQADQTGVPEKIMEIRQGLETEDFEVFFFEERYRERKLRFQGYHAAHFLLVVGADGLNYLGAEVKYQRRQVIADVLGEWDPRFLWRKERLEHIETVNSNDYPALGSRHRGVLYNNLIESLLRTSGDSSHKVFPSKEDFLFPHIL